MNSIKMLRGAICALTVITCSSYAHAVVLLDKPLNTSNYGWNSNAPGLLDGYQQIADDLTLSTASSANQLTWYGFNQGVVASQPFRVRIFADVAGTPAAIPFYDHMTDLVSGASTGLTNNANESILQYSAPIPSVALDANTPYWLMIASTHTVIWTWTHANAGEAGNNSFARHAEPGPWSSLIGFGYVGDQLEQSFRLEQVPEPSALVLALAPAVICLRRLPLRQRTRTVA